MSDDFLKVKKFTKEEKWQLLADCIRSGQVEARELNEEKEWLQILHDYNYGKMINAIENRQ